MDFSKRISNSKIKANDKIINNFYNVFYDRKSEIEELKAIIIEKDNIINNLTNDKKNLQKEINQLNQYIKNIEKSKKFLKSFG
jgi:uncharacterized coiled-coil DUF342 family protein